ncbi:MAG: DUF1365 domain-containing protein [Actinobacteria bacterium HGW-Actinobacteria-6]|jgi:hypothetical protein|nr:MAG: DUF1365 domain-containing protein [Actinobacteria bacterium HGW-Actinobacteria-6]
MESRVFEGQVAHERSRPVRNRFRYRVYLLYLDLAELDELDHTVKRFRYNRPGWVSFYDRDHGPRDGTPLRPWIDALLGKAGIDLDGGPVRLLSFPRSIGFRFFPASFWYCFSAEDELLAVLAEVHNTFGGQHNYLLHRGGEPMGFSDDLFAYKVFHVSPFIPMGGKYRFRFTAPGDAVSVSIHEDVEGSPLLTAGVSGRARAIDDPTLRQLVWRYGPMPLRAWLLIHFQAIRLALKRVRFYSDPGMPEEETTLDSQNSLRSD